MKFVIVIALIGVLAALASAGFFMLRKSHDGEDVEHRDKRMARALAVRVGLSIALFLFILVSWMMGWISPSGIPTGR
jgi:Mn2+/Fe2+ NRAMP family transporter